MIRQIDPAIKLIGGTRQISKDFGGVHSIPAAYIFDGNGKQLFRLGGDYGPNGRHFLRMEQLERAINGNVTG